MFSTLQVDYDFRSERISQMLEVLPAATRAITTKAAWRTTHQLVPRVALPQKQPVVWIQIAAKVGVARGEHGAHLDCRRSKHDIFILTSRSRGRDSANYDRMNNYR